MNQLHLARLDPPVAMASPTSLLVRRCERLALELARGLDAQHRGDAPVAHRELLNAQQTVLDLRGSLRDSARGGSVGLARLYDFLRLELVRAKVTLDPRIIEACIELVTDLATTWRGSATHAARRA